jgi:hypothetical protein
MNPFNPYLPCWSTSLFTYLSVDLPRHFLTASPIYLVAYLPRRLLTSSPTYLVTYLSRRLPTLLPICLHSNPHPLSPPFYPLKPH